MNRDEKLKSILQDYQVWHHPLHKTIEKINRLFKGKKGYWCPKFNQSTPTKCPSVKDCTGATKDCNRRCRVILED